jgi:uncharacterized protein (DUF1330 family)
MPALTLVMLAQIPPDGIEDYQTYESTVLPLLPDHGGVAQRRLRSGDSTVEIHVVSFPSEEALAAYLADPRRQAAAPMLERSGATTETIAVTDVAAS